MSRKKEHQKVFLTNRQIEAKKEIAIRELSRRRLKDFVAYTFPKKKDKAGNILKEYIFTDFHHAFIRIIQAFIDGKIKKLMVSVPPQHGKTEIATRRLVAYLLGRNPSSKVAVVSYSASRAARFGNDIKEIITGDAFKKIFPGTRLPTLKDKHLKNTSDYVDVLGGVFRGSLYLAGRGGGLTGDEVDYLIMDDLYKNAEEANSPVTRQSVVEWYDKVGDSRLNNESQQLIVFTRWHDQDLIGHIQENETVINLDNWEQVEKDPDPDAWYSINFEALKLSAATEIDPRETGEPLYSERHSRKKLEATRKRITKYAPESWNALYMGDPRPIGSLLYGQGFKTYTELPKLTERRAYVDVADQGDDYLCAIAYGVGLDNYLYLLDVVYSKKPAEITHDMVLELLIRNKVHEADFESNSAGYAYAQNIKRLLADKMWTYTLIETFHQGKNKEARIKTIAPEIMRLFMMPEGWQHKHPEFAGAVNSFRSLFKSNKYDDAPDTLTGGYEKSGIEEFWTPDDEGGGVSDWC